MESGAIPELELIIFPKRGKREEKGIETGV